MSLTETGGRFHRTLVRLERLSNRVRRDQSKSKIPPEVVCYYGYSNREVTTLRGRVVRAPYSWEAAEGDSSWRNFRGMAGNWFTDEVPFAEVTVFFEGASAQCKCNEEGYFVVTLPTPGTLDPTQLWTTYTAEVEGGSKTSEGRVQLLPESAQRIIISDIDDTVIETGAAQLWQMVKTTLLENVHTRKIFPGVSEFYTSLQNGVTGAEQNPIFYVTSSPWNLRAFIMKVFKARGTPHGPAFMTDWGLSETKFIKAGHGEHKLAAIKEVLSTYPDLPVVLIGDSGEKDPEIYTEIVEGHPGRIEVIFIRDVSGDLRDKGIAKLAARCQEAHVELRLVADTAMAVTLAEASGLVAKGSELKGKSEATST